MDVPHLLENFNEVSVIPSYFLELYTNCGLVVFQYPHANFCFHRYGLIFGSWVLLGQGEFDFVFLAANNWVDSKSSSDELNKCSLEVLRIVIRKELCVLFDVDSTVKVLVKNFALLFQDVFKPYIELIGVALRRGTPLNIAHSLSFFGCKPLLLFLYLLVNNLHPRC